MAPELSTPFPPRTPHTITPTHVWQYLKIPVTTVSLARSIVVFARTAFQRQRPCGLSQWHQPGHAAAEISLRTAVCAKMMIGPQARCAECRWLRLSSGPGAICRAIRGRSWESVLHSQSAAFSPLSPAGGLSGSRDGMLSSNPRGLQVFCAVWVTYV